MPTSADRFVLAFRHWLNRYAGALLSAVLVLGFHCEMFALSLRIFVFDLFQPRFLSW
jgi:hypothetical protein